MYYRFSIDYFQYLSYTAVHIVKSLGHKGLNCSTVWLSRVNLAKALVQHVLFFVQGYYNS